ncbi:hypothetical protein LTR85_001940 [Meristemomyces frigidus]|nr:hypothetical protein LTR85_001940 [Meristemomyces frigidus]
MKQLPQLQRVTIDLHIVPYQSVDICKQTLAKDSSVLTSIPRLSRLDVYYGHWEDILPCDWDYSDRQGPVMKWDTSHGVLEDLGKTESTEASASELEPAAGGEGEESAVSEDEETEFESG